MGYKMLANGALIHLLYTYNSRSVFGPTLSDGSGPLAGVLYWETWAEPDATGCLDTTALLL